MIVFLGLIFLIIFIIVGINANSGLEKEYKKFTNERINETYSNKVSRQNQPNKVIVPDRVDSQESTRFSTQSDECKVYDNVNRYENVIVEKVGKSNTTNTKINNYKKYEEDPIKEYEDNPIKEGADGFFSRLFKKWL